MKKSKVIITFLIVSIFFIFNSSVNSMSPKDIKKEIREGMIEASKPAQIRKEVQKELREKIKIMKFAARTSGTVVSINTNSIDVTTGDGKIITVNISAETKLKRKFWGNTTLSEFATGHTVNVIGKWTDESKTAIDAKIIRDESIQKRWGVFFGKVTAKKSDSFMMETVNRGTQTVYFGSLTKFFKINMEAMTYEELEVGHRVRVKGVWDNSQNKIIEVEQVKDFSLGKIKTTTVVPTL